MGTTVIYHKNEDDKERAKMEHDYQELTARKKPRLLSINLSGKWNKMVEAIAAAACFSTIREKLANRKKDED
ncbi:MAG: hypothetical protein JRJ45_10380 [Deltaproteobacteria bacterium]|nr:hypothetical protein [Deltaproteobacteria bacterium]